ncbi:hypothetical protein GCM10028819_46160 [Spirosoma humi]
MTSEVPLNKGFPENEGKGNRFIQITVCLSLDLTKIRYSNIKPPYSVRRLYYLNLVMDPATLTSLLFPSKTEVVDNIPSFTSDDQLISLLFGS